MTAEPNPLIPHMKGSQGRMIRSKALHDKGFQAFKLKK